MDPPCPPSHHGFLSPVRCRSVDCPRFGLLIETGKACERAPESEEVRTASKQQKEAKDLYREAAQTAAKHPDEHGTLPERLRALNEEAKKVTVSQRGAHVTGMPQIQPLTQWPGFARERVDWYGDGGRDLEHDKPVGWQPNALAYSKFPLLQPSPVPHNKNQLLPDWPGPFVLEQSTMGNYQADTFTVFAPVKGLPSSRSPHRRELPFAPDKDASCADEHDDWDSVISSDQSQLEFTPESTPEQEGSHAISAPAEVSKVQVQPNAAHHNLSNAPGKPVYKFVPFRNVPRIIDEGTGEDYQRWLEVSNRLSWSGSAHPPFSEAAGKNHSNFRPVRNDNKTNTNSSGPVRRDAMTFATGDLREKIEKVARYVARSGPKFEEVVRSKNQGTDIVSFLEPTNTYHTYYKWRVEQCKAGNTYDFESEETAAETDCWSEHINRDGSQHWYNKASREFVRDKPLVLVAQFQPQKVIGQGIEKRELDFLGDCVKFLPSAVRSKAIAVVDKLQNIAYGALSDEPSAKEEDDTAKNLQKVEAEVRLIKEQHTETQSVLLKRIEELENKQTPQMSEATATKLNALYDKQASQKSDDTADRLEVFKREVLETHSALLKNIQGVDGDMHSRTSELAATLDRICEEAREVIDEQVKAFRDERTSIADEHKKIVSAILERTEELEKKQSSEVPELVASQLSALSDKLEHVDGRLHRFESVQQTVDNKNSDILTELHQRIEELENKQGSDLDAASSQLQKAFAAHTVLRDQVAKLEVAHEAQVDAVAKIDKKASKAFDYAKVVGGNAKDAQTDAEKALEQAVKTHNLVSGSREEGVKTVQKASELPWQVSLRRDAAANHSSIIQVPFSELPKRHGSKVESRLDQVPPKPTPEFEEAAERNRLEHKQARAVGISRDIGISGAGRGRERTVRHTPHNTVDRFELLRRATLDD